MTILNKLTFDITNCLYSTFISEKIYSGNMILITFSILCTNMTTFTIKWYTGSDIELCQETASINANSFFNQMYTVKGSYFMIEIDYLGGSNLILQTFYH